MYIDAPHSGIAALLLFVIGLLSAVIAYLRKLSHR